MSEFINTVDSVGDEELTRSIIDRSITELADNISTIIGMYAFSNCSALTNINLPNVTNVGYYAFRNCAALARGDFASCVEFGENAFYGCSALTALILRNTEAVSSLKYDLSSTAIASGTGYIYVPSALIDTYKTATNWSTYAEQFRAIEDYPGVCDPYTWEGVFANIDNGTYKDVYSVGDLVPLDLGSEGVVNMQIAGFDVDDLADGSGKAPISWISKELLATSHRMNPARVENDDGTYQEGTGSIGGWEKSEMRAYLKESIKPLIPEKVSNRIITVTKTQNACDKSGSSFDQTTEDDVWIPSSPEMGNSSSKYYELFQNTNANRIKKKPNGTAADNWWARNAAASDSIYRVTNTGAIQFSSAERVYNIALGFCT